MPSSYECYMPQCFLLQELIVFVLYNEPDHLPLGHRDTSNSDKQCISA